MKKNPNSTLLAAVALLALALPGCSKHQEKTPMPAPKPASQAKPAAVPTAPTAAAAAAPVQKRLSSASAGSPRLDFRNRTDPFRPYAPALAAPQPKGEQAPAPSTRAAADLLPIQTFEVSKFKVAGIIAGLRENRALILDPNGKGYVVQQGMLIGNHDGRITRITASSVEVTERYKDDRGKSRKRTIVLTLAKKR